MRELDVCSPTHNAFLFSPCQYVVPLYLTSARLGIKAPTSPYNKANSPGVHHWSPSAGSDVHGDKSYCWAHKVWSLVLSAAHSLAHDVLGDKKDVDKMLQPIVNLLESVLNLFYKHLPWVHEPSCVWWFFLAVYEAAGAVLSQLPHAIVLRERSCSPREMRLPGDPGGEANCGWLCLSSSPRAGSLRACDCTEKSYSQLEGFTEEG